MSNLLELLTKIKRAKTKKTISPVVEYTRQKEKRRQKLIGYSIISMLVLTTLGGILLVNLLQEKKTIQQEDTREMAQLPTLSIENETIKAKVSESEKETSTTPVNQISSKAENNKVTISTSIQQQNTSNMDNDVKKLIPQKTTQQNKKDQKIEDKADREGKPKPDGQKLTQPEEPMVQQKSNKKRLYSHLYRVENYERKGMIEDAIAELKEAIAIVPSDQRLLNKMASLYIKIDRCDEAVKYIQRVLKSNPDYVKALVNLAVCQQRQGELKKAEETLLRALSIEPHNGYINYNLGVFYEHRGNSDSAYKYYLRTVELGSRKTRLLALFAIAKIEKDRGNLQKAYRICRELLQQKDLPFNLRQKVEKLVTLLRTSK
jgi:Tfp pilus assembly protein PilF/cell division protein FtsB